MIKKLAVSFIATAVTIVFVVIVYAEMAKEGSGEYRSAKISTFDVLPMEKERLQMNYEQTGVVVTAPENSPLYKATFRTLGALHAIKGNYKSPGFVVWTNPNGDKIYATFDSEGTLGGESKSRLKFVGGTGSCTGIQGTMEIAGVAGFKPSKKGTGYGMSVGTFNWKIP